MVYTSTLVYSLIRAFIASNDAGGVVDLILKTFVVYYVIIPMGGTMSSFGASVRRGRGSIGRVSASSRTCDGTIVGRARVGLRATLGGLLLRGGVAVGSYSVVLDEIRGGNVVVTSVDVCVSGRFIQCAGLMSSVICSGFKVAPGVVAR